MQMAATIGKGCALSGNEMEKIRKVFVSLAQKDDNPVVSFSRFLTVMQGVGIGSTEADLDFFKRLYKVFDIDGDRAVDFGELCDGLSMLLTGTVKEKMRLYYQMYVLMLLLLVFLVLLVLLVLMVLMVLLWCFWCPWCSWC